MQLMGIAALNPSYELCHRPETVIASEAKQSILSYCGAMDCFAALAMTTRAMDCFAKPVIGLALARPVGGR